MDKFSHLLVLVLVFVFISIDPPIVLFTMAAVYALSGPLLTLVYLRRRRAEKGVGRE